MGNCVRRESSMKWAGEDWGCLANDHHDHEDQDDNKQMTKKRKVMKIEEDEGEGLFSNSTANNNNDNDIGATTAVVAKEVKIKITKKQLEELLGRVELKEMSVQQVLTQLIQVSTASGHHHQRSWRPALHTIPEVN